MEDLLFAHPELLAPDLPAPRRQVVLSPSCRVDLLFQDETRTVLVEIKRGIVDRAAVEQVRRYRALLKKAGQSFTAYLVGRAISEEAADSLNRTGGSLQFRQIGIQIPREVVLCLSCRLARAADLSVCPYCGGRERVH